MEAKTNQKSRTDEELSFDEAVSYVDAAQPIREACEMANRAANKYLSFEGIKTINGLMDLVGMSISRVDTLSQEGRDVVLSEIERFYSKKIAEMD